MKVFNPLKPRSNVRIGDDDPLIQNIEAVVAMHAIAERQVDAHQRGVEALTANLGRPGFLYGILVGVCLWMVVNMFAFRLGMHQRDDPPFFWLQGIVGLSGLLMTTVVLITQNRQGKLSERREQLGLQMSLLTEQRTAKLIELMEELRRDMPMVRDRVDSQADALTKPIDPHEVVSMLEAKFEEVAGTDAAKEIVTDEIDQAAVETKQSIQRGA